MITPLQPQQLLPCLIWACLWLRRYNVGDSTAVGDLILPGCIEALLAAGGQKTILDAPFLLITGVLAITRALTLILKKANLNRRSSTFDGEKDTGLGHSPGPWATPSIIPARTSHTRFHPERHAFSYSYLLVGVPVGWSGRSGAWLSVDANKTALTTVNAADHLRRDSVGSGLRGKLDDYLKSQDIHKDAYPFAYLVTAPRVLGYNFNPVSFWYLFDSSRVLRAIILEVNNTFDERRMYFLEGGTGTGQKTASDFSTSWDKDFHVSPFNDREGSYSLMAADPGFGASNLIGHVANTITLGSPEKKAKLVARVFSTHPPIDASSISLATSFWLIVRYGWVGFVTFPRILREAWKLYFKRHLEVWFRPEVRPGSVGRTPTESEIIVERVFRDFVALMARNNEIPLTLHYKPTAGLGLPDKLVFDSMSNTNCKNPRPELELEVLTPAFYSRLVFYSDLRELVRNEALCTDPRNRTLTTSSPDLLTALLNNTKRMRKLESERDRLPIQERWRWALIRMLRCRPPAQSFPDELEPTSDSPKATKVRANSPLDIVAAQGIYQGGLYRRHVTKLFFAERYTGGFTAILEFSDVLIRVGLAYMAASFAPPNSYSDGQDLAAACIILNASHFCQLIKGP